MPTQTEERLAIRPARQKRPRVPEPPDEEFVIRPARRVWTPQLIGITGVQFSGKTLAALLIAAGLVRPGERVGMVDTENRRGSMYADNPLVRKAFGVEGTSKEPFDVIDLHPPFHPKRFVSAYHSFQKAGIALVITDTVTHAWDGPGGALEIKDKEQDWINAKKWTKAMSSEIRNSPMHHIMCMRAQEKTQIIGKPGTDKVEYVPIGEQPITEKNIPFDASVMIRVQGEANGQPATHLAEIRKYPTGMEHIFAGWKPQLITPDLGKRIRQWNEAAGAQDEGVMHDRLVHQAKSVAETGFESYKRWYEGLTPSQKRALVDDGTHADCKGIAVRADQERAAAYEPDADPAGDPPTE